MFYNGMDSRCFESTISKQDFVDESNLVIRCF